MKDSRGPTSVNGAFYKRRSVASVVPVLGGPSCSPSDDQELIRATLERQKAQRERVFSQDLPFSWLRLLVGVVSVAFVLTDVPRSGLGIRDLSSHYYLLEPDSVIASGTPWHYSVFRVTKEQATNTSARVWSYKFDTTSVVWRAFAQYLNVTEFPACLFYRERCPSSELSGVVVFSFVDSLVNLIAAKMRPPVLPGPRRRRMKPPSLILRTMNEYYDRVHDYLLPWLFATRAWRTNKAIFLPAAGIRFMNDTSDNKVCFGPIRPFFCQELWINFGRSCPPNAGQCRQVGRLYTHTMQRLRAVQARFPNASVDLTFLESAEDLQVSRASLSVGGFRRSDVSTIIRARTCSSSSIAMDNSDPLPVEVFTQDDCETIFVEDYRYEIVTLTSDVTQWYRFLVALRLVGQSYFFLRALALIVSCYYAFGPRLSRYGETCAERLRKTARLLSRVPTQCIVFGSPIPIACYTLAHAIDAAIMYRMLEIRFVTQNGILDLSLREFVSVAVIQMRSVWVYALLLHLCVRSLTWHRRGGWSDGVICGVVGVPEFFLTAMSGVNIVAQFRSTRLRSTRVLLIRETTRVGSKSAQVELQLQTSGHHGSGTNHLGGIIIDLKFLICLATLVAIVSVGRTVFLRLRARRRGFDRPGIGSLQWPLGRTPVPYSAGTLWPAVSLCVHWTSDFFCIRGNDEADSASSRLRSSRVAPAPRLTAKANTHSEWRLASVQDIRAPSMRMSTRVFQLIQHQMESLHKRNSEVEGNVAFMNLVLMSDPLVLFLLRFGNDARKNMAYYQSLEHPDKVLLLPEAVVMVENEPMCYLRMIRRVHLQDLHWSELVQCG